MKFSGTFPSELLMLSRLTHLDLSNNKNLEGTLPRKFYKTFHGLRVLDLSRNRFHGTISPEIGALERLKLLGLQANNFSGAIPTELELLSDLQTLWLQYNPLLSGTIPSAHSHKLNSKHLTLAKTNITACPEV